MSESISSNSSSEASDDGCELNENRAQEEVISLSDSGESESAIKKRKYFHTYSRQWEDEPELRGWLNSSERGASFAHCTACNTDINITNGKIQLYRHLQRKEHVSTTKNASKQRTLKSMTVIPLETQVKDAMLKLTAFAVEHNLPLAVMDHVPNLLRAVCPDSNIAKNINSEQTKTTNIIKHVTGEYSYRMLISALRKNKFSLMIDETTDRTSMKHLSLVVRLEYNSTITDCFLTLLPVENAQAEKLFHQIVNFFDVNDIPYISNLIGFAADGGSNLMERHNSVASRFSTVIPGIFIQKCVWHSFALCASSACCKLPYFVENLARNVYNYFSNSPKSISAQRELQEFCKIKVHKILHPLQTRWLSLIDVVQKLLEHYDALVVFFSDVCSNANGDIQATNILEALRNPESKLYLQFLYFVLSFFVGLNRQIQSETPQISNIYSAVKLEIKAILDCFIKPAVLNSNHLYEIDYRNPTNMLPLEDMYFGAGLAANTMAENQLLSIKKYCLAFYIEAISQIMIRFPLRNNPVQDLDFLNPISVKKKKHNSIAQVASKWPHLVDVTNLQDLDHEWRLLRNIDTLPPTENILEFWSAIRNVKFPDNTPMFPNISNFVYKLLILPHSSANVERVFSTINLLKTKQRPSLSTDTIIGLLHSKRLMKNECYNFEISNDLRRLMTNIDD